MGGQKTFSLLPSVPPLPPWLENPHFQMRMPGNQSRVLGVPHVPMFAVVTLMRDLDQVRNIGSLDK